MSLVVIGINHKKAHIDIREKFSFSSENICAAYEEIKKYAEIAESFILSTCNRVELYAAGENSDAVKSALKRFLAQTHEAAPEVIEEFFYIKTDESAMTHLFSVAAGLDSMIIGEQEILRQIKTAYEKAKEAGACLSILHKAIQDALKVGKKVRSMTGISRGVTSTPGALVELLKQEKKLEKKKVFVIGAGKIGGLAVSKIAGLGIKDVTVTSRDIVRAEEKVKGLDINVVSMRYMEREIKKADIVIAATAAPGYILNHEMVKKAVLKKRSKTLMVDLGVPRNIDEKVKDIAGVRLYNIDDLAPIIQGTIDMRRLEALKAEEIVRSEVEKIRVCAA